MARRKWAQTDARALRGGSWNNEQDNLRYDARNRNNPDNNWNNNGFRPAPANHARCPTRCRCFMEHRTEYGHDMRLILRGHVPTVRHQPEQRSGRLLQ